jgi:hypothetical protein
MDIDTEDFTTAGIKVTDFHVHNIGTVVAEGTGTVYLEPGDIKFYLDCKGEMDGKKDESNQCFLNKGEARMSFVNSPYPFFLFQAEFRGELFENPLDIKIRLCWPFGKPFSFHQPYVKLPSPGFWRVQSPVTLTPSVIDDKDNDIVKYLWFENFDTTYESFLGVGETLTDVEFGVGKHEITVVAYDQYGAHYTDTSILTILSDEPVAMDDNYEVDEDSELNVAAKGVLENDLPVKHGDILTAIKVSEPGNGTLTWNPDNDGSFNYVPDADWNGTDSFTYKASDGSMDSNNATVKIAVKPMKDKPAAVDDNYEMNEDGELDVAAKGVLLNDEDVDVGDVLTAIKVSDPADGTLTWNPNNDGSFKYKPDADWNGTDSFTYKANDGSMDSNIATVNILVNPINEKPVALNDSYSVNEDNNLVVVVPGVLKNDKDVDVGDILTAIKVSDPTYGTLLWNPNNDGSFIYMPNLNYNGPDIFTYKANDGKEDSNIAAVAIMVKDIPPIEELSWFPPEHKKLPLNLGKIISLDMMIAQIYKHLIRGETEAACNLLETYLNKVDSLIRGKLITQEQAQPLIKKAENIMAEIGC